MRKIVYICMAIMIGLVPIMMTGCEKEVRENDK